MSMDASSFLFPLNRPEYPRNPEVLQSSLAWSLVPPEERGDRKLGLVYQELERSGARSVKIVQTRPSVAEALSLAELGGLTIDGVAAGPELVTSLWDALQAVPAEKAKTYSPTPITPTVAMMQNAVGAHAKGGPPNFAEIVEQVFRAGAHSPVPTRGAAILWYEAMEHVPYDVLSLDPLTKFIDDSARKMLRARLDSSTMSFAPQTETGSGDCVRPTLPEWVRPNRTPMGWFHQAWETLCQPPWRTAPPGQRWTDWASCVPRTSIALTFLWEARFYQELGRALLRDDRDAALDGLPDRLSTLLRWRDADSAVSLRDQNSRIIRTIIDGTEVRRYLSSQLVGTSEALHETWRGPGGLRKLGDWFHGSNREVNRRSYELGQCFGRGKSAPANNVLETVRYLLLARAESGRQADHYGLLRRRSRRFLVFQPGEEWIVVLASLAAKHPGGRTTLGDLRSAVRALGIYVERQELVRELERAGLSRSSHDADDAIVVWSGF